MPEPEAEGLARALERLVRLLQTEDSMVSDFPRQLDDVRQKQRDLDEKLDCVICVMQHDLEQLRAGAAESARSIEELLGMVRELRGPVTEIVALRARAAGLILGMGILGSAVLWLAEPFYRFVVEHQYLKR